MTARGGILAAACSLLVIAGCAAEVERPTEEMTRATTLIDQAQKAGAQRYAAADLQRARDKLREADEAVEDGNEEAARQRALEATVDAELALARTASGEAQSGAAEIRRSTETLQQEAERSTTTTPNGTPR